MSARAVTEASFGVYVHVPWCKHVCPYCDFNVYVARRADWAGLSEALPAELAARAPAFGAHHAIDSVYFGGGTPSLAPLEVLERVLASVRARFGAPAEVTLEVEPRTVDAARLRALRGLGVTRLSLGWQSTHDRLLRVLGRGHSADDSARLLAMAREAGFDNVSLDLIFAVPGESMDDLERDLDAVTALAPEHVSLYALTYHEGTELFRRREAGRIVAVEEELELQMMLRIEERLGAAGYEHYEVSNYARPKKRSLHNQIYWKGGEYLGIGPGAHSFSRQGWERGWRWEAVRSPEAYVMAWRSERLVGRPLEGDDSVAWVEELSARQLLAERLLVGLRMPEGVDLAALALGEHAAVVEEAARRAEAQGWLVRTGSRLVPTAQGLANADSVAELFF